MRVARCSQKFTLKYVSEWFRFIVKNSLYPSCTDCPVVEARDYARGSKMDCWGNVPSCGECWWARKIILCPIPMEGYGKF